jgi:hypothetical protein
MKLNIFVLEFECLIALIRVKLRIDESVVFLHLE